MATKDIDQETGVETTGHEWDGITELNNPLPRWWLWTFYASIIFAIGYMIYYPAIPLINGSTLGISGQTNRLQLRQELEAVEAANRAYNTKLVNTELGDIHSGQELARYASAAGGSLFKIHCSQCHGSGAAGSSGFPNLNDDDWLWGGDIENIYTTIKHGVRNARDDARFSQMPSFGADGLLDRPEIAAVAEYVLKLSAIEHDATLAQTGGELYGDNCASCHGDEGKGGVEFGAPNLADALALYGTSREQVTTQIANPRHGVMPAWGTRLGDAAVRQLAIYVHGLGGGE